jgi:UDP-N-acetylmuramyl tripeptide synthase
VDLASNPTEPFEDSRRLPGANLWFDRPAVVLAPLGEAAGDATAQARWAQAVCALAAALGWPDAQPVAAHHALAFAAPEDALFTATEVNEWAWARAAAGNVANLAAGIASSSTHFARLAAAEHSPPLVRLRAAARAHSLPVFEDDDSVSVGAGAGSLAWPRAALPLPMDVPWAQLHDIPRLLVTGSNGKTTTTRLLAAMAARAGFTAGLCSTEGVVVGGQQVLAGDYAGPAGARAVLRQPGVTLAVLETARGGLLRRGLAVACANVAVVTNISPDHLGEYGVESAADLAEVKLIVAHAVRRGWLVLNADDVVLMATAARLPHAAAAPQALFARDHAHPALAALRARGGSTCGVEAGQLVLHHAGMRTALGGVAGLPLTLGGAALHNIENACAAALAAANAGLPVAAIADTLREFGARPQDNPGRLERWTHRGGTVLIDYAHNPDGLAQLLRVARALQPRRLGLLLGQAGNRDDAAIAELARTAAGFAPDLVLIKELPDMLRGREPGTVPALIEQALRSAGLPAVQLAHVADELAAAQALLAWAQPGDCVVLPVHTRAVRERLREQLCAQPQAAG